MLLNCGVGEDSWESLGLQGDATSSSYRRSVLGVHWKDWCWSWNSSTLATSCEELTHWKRLWCWEGLRAGGKGNGQSDGQGGLVCCNSWVTMSWTWLSDWSELIITINGVSITLKNCEWLCCIPITHTYFILCCCCSVVKFTSIIPHKKSSNNIKRITAILLHLCCVVPLVLLCTLILSHIPSPDYKFPSFRNLSLIVWCMVFCFLWNPILLRV